MAQARSPKRQSGGKLTPEEFRKQLRAAKAEHPGDPVGAFRAAGIVSPLVFIGAQQVRVRRIIEWLREDFLAESKTAFSSYFGRELQAANSAAHILSTVGSLSLFEQLQLVLIYEADKIKAAAAKPLAEALEREHQGTIVILTSDAPNTKSPLLSRLPKRKTLVEFKDLAPAILKKWIAKEVSLTGNTAGIEPRAAEMLVRSYGSDITALAREIQKLSLLTAPDEKITASAVAELSLQTPEVTSFELMQQIAKKNVSHAAALAEDLVGQGLHPLQLSTFLSRCIRTMLATKNISTVEVEHSGLHSELTNAWFLRNLGSANRSFEKDDLRAALEVLKELDSRLKDSGLPHELTLSLAVQRMASRAFV